VLYLRRYWHYKGGSDTEKVMDGRLKAGYIQNGFVDDETSSSIFAIYSLICFPHVCKELDDAWKV